MESRLVVHDGVGERWRGEVCTYVEELEMATCWTGKVVIHDVYEDLLAVVCGALL